jgi:hypothetical protein
VVERLKFGGTAFLRSRVEQAAMDSVAKAKRPKKRRLGAGKTIFMLTQPSYALIPGDASNQPCKIGAHGRKILD